MVSKKKKNVKGFTLIELLATLVVLGLVMGIASYAIINTINKSKEKNYELLIDNIRGGAEVYYQECRYSESLISKMNDANFCKQTSLNSGVYVTTLNRLVEYGYVTGNSNNADGTKTIINPNTNDEIGDCSINISYSGGKVVISSTSSNSKCPTEY